MKTASPALIAYLNSGAQFLMADLVTFTLNGGFVVRYTSADIDITCGGRVFKKFLMTRTRTKTSVGLEVDTLDITINADVATLLNGVPWLAAARNGALDGADVTIERLFMPTWGDDSLGPLLLFAGRVSDVEAGRTAAKLTVKSELELLDTKLPRNFFQSGCGNTLFDSACALNKAAKAIAGAATSSSVSSITSALGQADGYFSLGTITLTSGANTGVSRSVKSYAGGTFALALPFVAPVAPGDTFLAYPGCDKTKATCEAKFGNVVNFRGFPFVPDPETAI